MNRIVKALIISLVISGFLVSGGFLLVKKIRENDDLHSLLKNKPAADTYTAQGTLRLTDDYSDSPSPSLGPLRKRIRLLCAHLQLQKTSEGAYTLIADGIKDRRLFKKLVTTNGTLQWWPVYNITEFFPFLERADSLTRLAVRKQKLLHTDTSRVTTVDQLLDKKESKQPVNMYGKEDGKLPLFSMLSISSHSSGGAGGDYGELGYVDVADTPALNNCLKDPIVRACIPADAELLYGKTYLPEGEKEHKLLYLYAIRKTQARPMLDGCFLKDAALSTGQRSNEQQVTLSFNQMGASRLERLTETNIDHSIAMLAGNEVLVAPRVSSPIHEGTLLFSTADEYDARLVYLLAKYPLPAPVGIDRLAFAVQPPPSPFKPIWLLIGLAVFSLVFLLTLSIDKAFKNMTKGKRQ